jgi:hypothetical protein
VNYYTLRSRSRRAAGGRRYRSGSGRTVIAPAGRIGGELARTVVGSVVRVPRAEDDRTDLVLLGWIAVVRVARVSAMIIANTACAATTLDVTRLI